MAAISLVNVIEVAKNAFIACLVISADSTDIHSTFEVMGDINLANITLSSGSRTPTTILSGLLKILIDCPSLRFSGEHANLSCNSEKYCSACASKYFTEPTGNCDETKIKVFFDSKGITDFI